MPRGFLSEDAQERRGHRVRTLRRPPVDWVLKHGIIGPESEITPDNDEFNAKAPDVGAMEVCQ